MKAALPVQVSENLPGDPTGDNEPSADSTGEKNGNDGDQVALDLDLDDRVELSQVWLQSVCI